MILATKNFANCFFWIACSLWLISGPNGWLAYSFIWFAFAIALVATYAEWYEQNAHMPRYARTSPLMPIVAAAFVTGVASALVWIPMPERWVPAAFLLLTALWRLIVASFSLAHIAKPTPAHA